MNGSIVFEVLGHQKSDGFRRYFRKASEGAREWHFFTLLAILGAHFGDCERCFAHRNFDDFLSERVCDFRKGRRQRVVPPEAFLKLFLG